MPIKKKKKKELKVTSRGGGSGGVRPTSDLRPSYVPKQPPCGATCPSAEPIRKYLRVIAAAKKEGTPLEAAYAAGWKALTTMNPIPAVMGRVCPHPCEGECNRGHLDAAVNINSVERFLGDYATSKGLAFEKVSDAGTGKKVAVVGSGPAGLSCAYQLARRGYSVTMFEAQAEPGGMLRWGIPAYRLPRDVIKADIDRILALGVDLKLNSRVESFDSLKSDFDAVFVGIGAWTGLKLRLEGEDAPNVLSGIDYLWKVNNGEKPEIGDNVVVVGGGNTAIDAARCAIRTGAKTTILYRRTIAEMPADEHEIEECQNEGVDLQYLAAPVKLILADGKVTAITAQKMELGEPDDSGRRRPVPIEGSEYEIPVSALIPAISQAPDFSGFEQFIEGRDWFKVDDKGATTVGEGAFAGGDALNLGLVTDAVGAGRRAAEGIHEELTGEKTEYPKLELITHDKLRLDSDAYPKIERGQRRLIPVAERLANPDAEVDLGMDEEAVIAEAGRCLSCGMCFNCEKCWQFCQDGAVEKNPPDKRPDPANGTYFYFILEKCVGCKKCGEECPCGFIDLN